MFAEIAEAAPAGAQPTVPILSILPLEVELPGGAPTQVSALENKFLDLARRYSGARVASAESTAGAVSLLPVGRRDFRASDGDLAGVAARASTLYAMHATFRAGTTGKATLTGRVVRDDGQRVASAEAEMAREPKDKLETLVAALALKLFMDLRVNQLPVSRELAPTPPTQLGRAEDRPLLPTPAQAKPPLMPTGHSGSGSDLGAGAGDRRPGVDLATTGSGQGRRASPVPAYVLLSIGAAAAVAGVVLLAMVPPLQRDASGNFAFEDRAKVSGALQLQTAGWSFLAGGAAVAGGGGIWWWLTSSSSARPAEPKVEGGGKP
jgi:hypothetical protein